MNDRAVYALIRFLDEYSEPPGLDWPQEESEEVTFSRWAAEELLNLVMDHPMTPAEDTIEEFIIKMEIYAATATKRDWERIFSIVAQTAREFLDLI